jgi:hypothetical protein
MLIVKIVNTKLAWLGGIISVDIQIKIGWLEQI